MAGFFATAYNRQTKNIHFGDQYRIHIKDVTSGALVTIYEDAAQTITKTNPFSPTRDGDIVFFAPASTYTLELYNRELLIDTYPISSFGVSSGLSFEGGAVFNEAGSFSSDFRVEGGSLSHAVFVDATPTTENVAFLSSGAPSWESMDRGIFIGAVSTAPTASPTGGIFLWADPISDSGSLRVREATGNNRFFAVADSSTKTTAGAPYANDGYIEILIGGTVRRLMTTAG